MVREEGFEPSRPCGLGILSPVRLPFRHSRIYYLLPPNYAEYYTHLSPLCQHH